MDQQTSIPSSDLHDLSFLRYLEILGFKPVASNKSSSDYQVHFNCAGTVTIKIDHLTNRFLDQANNRQGNIIDFACLLFEISPKELLDNVCLYRIDQLMSSSGIANKSS